MLLKTDRIVRTDEIKCDEFIGAYLAETDLKRQKSNQKNVSVLNQKLKSRATKEEMHGLIDNGTFEILAKCSTDENTSIFELRFVDSIKHGNGGVCYKSRVVAQSYGDEQSATIATKAPKVQRLKQCLLLSLVVSLGHMTVITRDITLAYIQPSTPL